MVLNELKNRGVQDILIACTDNLNGFSEVIQADVPANISPKVYRSSNSQQYPFCWLQRFENDNSRFKPYLQGLYGRISIGITQ